TAPPDRPAPGPGVGTRVVGPEKTGPPGRPARRHRLQDRARRIELEDLPRRRIRDPDARSVVEGSGRPGETGSDGCYRPRKRAARRHDRDRAGRVGGPDPRPVERDRPRAVAEVARDRLGGAGRLARIDPVEDAPIPPTPHAP